MMFGKNNNTRRGEGEGGITSRQWWINLFDKIHFWFFASHIPATVFLDMQALLPRSYFPSFARSTFDFHVSNFNDPLMGPDPKPIWFKSMLLCEALFQLPFFFWAASAIKNGDSSIRIPGIIYGAHTATTLVPVLATVLFDDNGLTLTQRLVCSSIYFPWLIIPLTYIWRLWVDEKPYEFKRPVKRS